MTNQYELWGKLIEDIKEMLPYEPLKKKGTNYIFK